MSEHRPECIYTPEHFDPEQNIVWGGKPCICEEIKRAEKRVLDALDLASANVKYQAVGFAAALDAAEEAVRAALGADERNLHAELTALAAIDALRKEQAPPPLPPSVGVPSKPMWPLREEQK